MYARRCRRFASVRALQDAFGLSIEQAYFGEHGLRYLTDNLGLNNYHNAVLFFRKHDHPVTAANVQLGAHGSRYNHLATFTYGCCALNLPEVNIGRSLG
jgi:hypothetical protein